jgi:tRNA pseudouridine38-40 synthase
MVTPSTQRIALCLQYDGSAFNGWQRQRNAPSVQATLEEALRQLDPSGPGQTMAAGRTDTGVHAAAQVVHFDCAGPIPAPRWPKALNGRLPSTIRVREARAVPADWQGMLGEHDFAAFQRAGSRRSHSRTQLQEVAVLRDGDLISVELQASGFLYGMVRLVMGQLVAVAEGRLAPELFEARWRQQRRAEVKEAAPPQGLCLLRVGYPKPVFPEPAWYDCQPRFQLGHSDPPDQTDPEDHYRKLPAGQSVDPQALNRPSGMVI